VLLACYALLPEQYRFSRGMLLFGALLAAGSMSVLRWLLTKMNLLPRAVYKRSKPYILIAGSVDEYEETKKLLGNKSGAKIIGRVSPDEDHAPKIATLDQVETIASALNAQELVLCSGTASNKQFIAFIQTIKQALRLRFHAAGSSSIVGSDSSTATGEAVSLETAFNMALPLYRRLKRLIDVVTALLFLLFFPIHFLVLQKPVQLLANAAQVLIGQKTWIGYAVQTTALPPLRPAVLTSDGEAVYEVLKKLPADHQVIDFWYARNWEPVQDIKLIFKNYRRLSS